MSFLTEHQQHLKNNGDLHTAGQAALALAYERQTSKNSKKLYGSKQEEWKRWCTTRNFQDAALVSEDKLILFLTEEVFGRSLRGTRFQKLRTNADGEQVHRTIGTSSIESYVSAVISLYDYQKAMGINFYERPRGKKLKSVLKDRLRKEHDRKKKEYHDRGVGTLADGYGLAEMERIVRGCWTQFAQTGKGVHSASTVEAHLRTMADFLLSHNMLLRSESRRQAELADLFLLPLQHEGPTECNALVMIMSNGKTNQFNRLEYGAVIRNRETLLCPISSLAFYFFYRWNIVREAPPNFQQRQKWYDIPVFTVRKNKKLSYYTQYDWTCRIFNAALLSSMKKTHAGRTEGVKYAELGGVAEGQIRRAGRWNNDALSSCYLSSLPREFMRQMAGFRPSPADDYYLPRATVKPPESLVRSLWPWVDSWQAWFSDNTLCKDARPNATYEGLNLEPLVEQEEDCKDLAAQGFLRLLAEFRTVILQDSVILMAEFPGHPIWRDPVFVRQDYLDFAARVRLSIKDPEQPDELRLRQVFPEVASQITNSRLEIVRTLRDAHHEHMVQMKRLESSIEYLMHGSFKLIPGSGETATAMNTISTTLPPAHSTPARRGEQVTATPCEPLARATQQSAPPLDPDSPPPAYSMCRTIVSVRMLWREWTEGLGSNPSIEALEAAYGARWRPSQNERVFFGRRKTIIDELYRLAATIATPPDFEAAIQRLELVRGRRSIHSLWEELTKKQARTAAAVRRRVGG